MNLGILAFREKASKSSHRGIWSGFAFFCSEASVVLDIFMQCTEWCVYGLPARRGHNTSLPEGLTEPQRAISILPVLGDKQSPVLGPSSKRLISCLCLKKNQLSPRRGSCLLKTSLKALSASFLSFSCQDGCYLNFATVKFISCSWRCPDLLYHTHMPVKW